MPEWQVLSARLTVFVTADTVVPSTLWRDVVGEDPDSSFTQRATATRTETGPFAEGTLRLQIQPMRIDWVHEAAGVGTEALPATSGPFPGASEPFLQRMRRWPESCWFPDASRIALGFTLISNLPDRETGYRELEKFIDGVPKAADATDFLYQVNRPRQSGAGIEGLQINRLSRWSVGAFVALSVNIAASVQSVSSPLLYHLRLELDINTSGDFRELIPRDSVGPVINDLLSGASEICQLGNRF
jgi:hypothetical protein